MPTIIIDGFKFRFYRRIVLSRADSPFIGTTSTMVLKLTT